jgi:hypothetical protein
VKCRRLEDAEGFTRKLISGPMGGLILARDKRQFQGKRDKKRRSNSAERGEENSRTGLKGLNPRRMVCPCCNGDTVSEFHDQRYQRLGG